MAILLESGISCCFFDECALDERIDELGGDVDVFAGPEDDARGRYDFEGVEHVCTAECWRGNVNRSCAGSGGGKAMT
jgi:hypothetical protein